MSARLVVLLAFFAAYAAYGRQPDPIYRETAIRHARPRAANERFDAQESDPKLRHVFAAADAAAERRVGNVKRDDRFIFAFWAEKKAILRREYSIDWKTPAELNPTIHYYSYGQRRITPQEAREITAVVRTRTNRRIRKIERYPKGEVRVWLSPEGNEATTYVVERRNNSWRIVDEQEVVFD